MKASCGWLYSKTVIKRKSFARSTTEYQYPLTCIFCCVETRSRTDNIIGGTSLFKPWQSTVNVHEPSLFSDYR